MAIPEQIYEIVKALPNEQANEVLDFVQFLKMKTQQLANRAEIDAALIEMTADPDYQADVTQLESEFAMAQWEALQLGDQLA
jgi:Protein of unknown function (DUF2281)